MLATFTEAAFTPFSLEEADEALSAALPRGSSPNVRALALAKTALETGRWKKIWNFNFGNIKAGSNFVGMFTCFACGEELAEGSCWFEPDGTVKNLTKKTVTKPVAYDVPPGHPQTRFRAYANRFDGAFEYVQFVKDGRYGQAWQALLAGDAVGYVHQLKLKGYFTAAEAPYVAAVVSLQKEFLGKLNGQSPEPAKVDWRAAQACARLSVASVVSNVMHHAGEYEPSGAASDGEPSA